MHMTCNSLFYVIGYYIRKGTFQFTFYEQRSFQFFCIIRVFSKFEISYRLQNANLHLTLLLRYEVYSQDFLGEMSEHSMHFFDVITKQ